MIHTKVLLKKTPLRNFFVFRENLLSHVLAGIQHDDELLRERKKILFSDVLFQSWIVCKKSTFLFMGSTPPGLVELVKATQIIEKVFSQRNPPP